MSAAATPTQQELTPLESLRIQALVELLPKGRLSVLDVGARDGRVSRLLLGYFKQVTALDLVKPQIDVDGVVNVQGDATQLEFPDDSFDSIVCTEVLEHLPPQLLPKACREIARVARYDVVIGVPYKQDIRAGRTTCAACGRKNPPWGHLNSFNEKKLYALFPNLIPISKSFAGSNKVRTNPLAVLLMDWGGNPWGAYDAGQVCGHCWKELVRPTNRFFTGKICSKLGQWIYDLQQHFVPTSPSWIHIVFQKREFALDSNSGICMRVDAGCTPVAPSVQQIQ